MKLHLGCGKRYFGKDWVHIDQQPYLHVDYVCNLRELPVEDLENVELIYASHALAYFDRKEAEEVLRHWYDVLEPGGTLRIATPDIRTMAHLYMTEQYSLEQFLGPMYGKIESAHKTIYHKTIYDFVSLKALLLKVGFSDVKEYDWRQTEHAEFDDCSQAYLPHMDKVRGALISLNIEATK